HVARAERAGLRQHRRPLADVEHIARALAGRDAVAVERTRRVRVGRPVVTRLLGLTVARAVAGDVAPQTLPRAPSDPRAGMGELPLVERRQRGVARAAIRGRADDLPRDGVTRWLLPRALGVELARLTHKRAVGADAGLADAAGTVRRRRRRDRAGTGRPLLAAELAVRVLVVRHVVLEGAVVEHVGLRLVGVAGAVARCPSVGA